jgi:hypothetical protein
MDQSLFECCKFHVRIPDTPGSLLKLVPWKVCMVAIRRMHSVKTFNPFSYLFEPSMLAEMPSRSIGKPAQQLLEFMLSLFFLDI